MTTLRAAAQQALEALENEHNSPRGYGYELSVYEARETSAAITALRAALAQQAEPVVGIIEPQIKVDSHQPLDAAMQQPRAMAQAYENGYKAGVAAEREACAQVCEARFVGDLNREDMEARRCAAAIRARGST